MGGSTPPSGWLRSSSAFLGVGIGIDSSSLPLCGPSVADTPVDCHSRSLAPETPTPMPIPTPTPRRSRPSRSASHLRANNRRRLAQCQPSRFRGPTPAGERAGQRHSDGRRPARELTGPFPSSRLGGINARQPAARLPSHACRILSGLLSATCSEILSTSVAATAARRDLASSRRCWLAEKT